ncbi:MAG: response regulator transcription factor [Clostridiaceae bacterium]|nr:response regulator transcription factor [Clostridiaceae bacterium]
MDNKVLLVEDDDSLREIITDYFEQGGFIVEGASSGLMALELWENSKYDLALLDIMLPEIDGFSLCRRLRKTSDIPIIIITARDDEDDKIIGYELGADDYVTKPFSVKFLLAKSQNLIKRSNGTIGSQTANVLEGAGIRVELLSRNVTIDGQRIELSPKEHDLLVTLMENKDRIMTREMLLEKVWGYDYFGDSRAVDTHIRRLRAKLGSKAIHISTRMKAGYKFEDSL